MILEFTIVLPTCDKHTFINHMLLIDYSFNGALILIKQQ